MSNHYFKHWDISEENFVECTCILFVMFLSSILTHDGSVHGLERDRVFLYDDSTHVLSCDQLRKVSVCIMLTVTKFTVHILNWRFDNFGFNGQI